MKNLNNIIVFLLTSFLFFSTISSQVEPNITIQNNQFKKNMFNQFINIFEPSGIAQLENGQVLIVDDDGLKPISLLKFSKKEPFDHLEKISEYNFGSIEVDDLEALTVGKNQYIYAITSHSRNRKGKLKHKRNRLIRFKFKNGQLANPIALENLRDWIVYSYPQLRKASNIKKVQEDGGLNIEGLAYHNNQLFIGLRSPLHQLENQSKAMIIPVNLGDNIFKNKLINNSPNPIITVDLDGAGIRDLSYIPELNGFLILSGNSVDDKKPAKLWFWKQGIKPSKIKIKGTNHLGTAEGITSAKLRNGDAGILITSDDGNREKNIPGHYLFIPYSNLKFKS